MPDQCILTVDFGPSVDRGTKRSSSFTNFPNIHLTIEDMIAEGDRVVCRLAAHGTHRGDTSEEHPAGREATWAAILIFRVADGKIVERWETRDELGQKRQLGLLPAQEDSGG